MISFATYCDFLKKAALSEPGQSVGQCQTKQTHLSYNAMRRTLTALFCVAAMLVAEP